MWEPPSIEHEILGTEVCLCFPEATFIRGFDVDETIQPDIEMYRNDEIFYIEIDTGKVPYARQKVRWAKYENYEGVLLIVTSSQIRLNGLIQGADAINEIALFTTFEELFGEPRGEIWQNTKGELFSVD